MGDHIDVVVIAAAAIAAAAIAEKGDNYLAVVEESEGFQQRLD